MRLFVSFPSDIRTSAFLRFCPACAIGTASATPSYIAVPPLGRTRASARLNAIAVVGPFVHQLRVGAEPLDEELVLLIRKAGEETIDRLERGHHFSPAMLPLVSSDDSETHRDALGTEVRDLDRLVVLVDEEVFLPEARDETPGAIGHGDVDVDQLDAALEPEALLIRQRAARAYCRRAQSRMSQQSRRSSVCWFVS